MLCPGARGNVGWGFDASCVACLVTTARVWLRSWNSGIGPWEDALERGIMLGTIVAIGLVCIGTGQVEAKGVWFTTCKVF